MVVVIFTMATTIIGTDIYFVAARCDLPSPLACCTFFIAFRLFGGRVH